MVIEIERTRSLDVPFAPDQLYGAIYGGESKAHKFIITAMRDGAEATLSGTVTAKFLRADNVCVALTGTIEGGKACVVLGDECYATPGRFVFTIFVASGEENLCVYAAIGTTNRTDGTSTVDGGNIIPSVSDLIAQIDAAVATIPASYSDLMGSVAGTYSASNTYAVGDYVWYDGVLYRCTTAISTAETWTAAHWSRAVLGDDVTDLKSALSESENGKRYISGVFSYGVFNSSNMPESDPRKFNAVMMTAEKYDRDITITAKTGYNFLAYWYNDSDVYVGKTGSWVTERTIPANTNFRLWVRQTPLDQSVVLDLTVVKQNIIFSTVLKDEIDANTNELNKEKIAIKLSNDGCEIIDSQLVHGKILTTSGHVGEVEIYNYTNQAVTPNAITFSTAKTIRANSGYAVQVWWYDDNDAYVSRSGNFVKEYSLIANRKYRFFMRNDPVDSSANIDISTFQQNVYLLSGIGERVGAIEGNPITTLPSYIKNNLSQKPLGSLSKGYILLSFDDGALTLATGTIPLLIENEVPGTFGLLPESAIFASGNESELATVVDAVENHGCVIAMHGSAQWPTYTELALYKYFNDTVTLFDTKGLGDTYGAICPGGNSADTSILVRAIAGGYFGYVFSGNRADKISYDIANASGKYNGARSNRFDLDRISGIGITSTNVQAIVNYAAENHLLLCPFWHDNTLNNVDHPEYITYFNALITAAKDAGLTFITTKDLPNIT